jgi:hypothetical protein
MKARVYIVIGFLIISTNQFMSQNKTLNDFAVIIHETTINKILEAVGPVNGSKDYSIFLMKGKYHWKAENLRIRIRPDSSQFICDTKVEVGPFTYKTKVHGDVKISYNKTTNQIQVKISRAIFELYTSMFGKKVHIKDIDLADYFKDPFSFEGPQSMGTDLDFMMPDGKMKKIYMQPIECELQIRWKEIIANFEIEACDVPFKTGKK